MSVGKTENYIINFSGAGVTAIMYLHDQGIELHEIYSIPLIFHMMLQLCHTGAMDAIGMIETLGNLIQESAIRDPDAMALRDKSGTQNYGELQCAIENAASCLTSLGVSKGDRVAVFAGKQCETVVAAFGASCAGGIFVPINALFKQGQVSYILNHCNVRVLVTTSVRLKQLAVALSECPDLSHVIVIDSWDDGISIDGVQILAWSEFIGSTDRSCSPRLISSDIAAIMYTSGSTGMPKGVVLSHGNMTVGAQSVAHYLENSSSDRILAVLPLSFDAGLSQLTTGFSVGACVVLHDYLIARDVVRIVEKESITGITGVPPLWMQLAEQDWPKGSTDSVRYFANTGGKMPRETLLQLQSIFTAAKPFLMYGLTEAFRSTYLPPEEVDRRPDSIGKAIPNVEVLVVNDREEVCQPGETGELVHRGPLVALGYWNDAKRTAERFRPSPVQSSGLPYPEYAVWSGDFVKCDEDGYLYFVGRKDDMIKTSGYRVSPAEVEEVAFDSGLIAEVAALGIPDPKLGQHIVLMAKAKIEHEEPTDALVSHMRKNTPNYMHPHRIYWCDSLPRNANGKLDRRLMLDELTEQTPEVSA